MIILRYFFLFLHKNICFGYSLEMLTEELLMRASITGLYGELKKIFPEFEIDHEIFSTVILSLPLIQEGQLSVSGERMCTILVNRLED